MLLIRAGNHVAIAVAVVSHVNLAVALVRTGGHVAVPVAVVSHIDVAVVSHIAVAVVSHIDVAVVSHIAVAFAVVSTRSDHLCGAPWTRGYRGSALRQRLIFLRRTVVV